MIASKRDQSCARQLIPQLRTLFGTRGVGGSNPLTPTIKIGRPGRFPTSIFLSHGYGLLFFAYEGDIGRRRICARVPAVELDSLDGNARKAMGPICPTEDSNRLILLELGHPSPGPRAPPIWIPWPKPRSITKASASLSAPPRVPPSASPCARPRLPCRPPSAPPPPPENPYPAEI
jgi:hypothetical protein